jgi:tetratricopeptide (TPR) repeat protein
MHSTSFEYPTPDNALEFFGTVAHAVLKHQPVEAICAFAEQHGPYALSLPPTGDNGAELELPPSPSQCRAVARAFISSMPRPELRFASSKEPGPEPGDPCDCGSDLTHERCCGAFLERVGALNPLLFMLPFLPKRQWPELAHGAVDPNMVAGVARMMLEARASLDVLALLAPWFEGKKAIPAAHAGLLNALLDAYDLQEQPRKKRQLLDKALKRGDHIIRSNAHQRLATLAADSGNYDSAWEHFEQAQEENPDDPDLSHLEVMLLLSQDDEEEARVRAQFWLEHLKHKGLPEDSIQINFLQNVVERGGEALLDFVHASEDSEAAFDHLLDLFDEAPTPAACYNLPHATQSSAGELIPLPDLAEALRLWQRKFPQKHPSLTMMEVDDHPAFSNADDWLDVLETHPVLWQSLEVLDDLVLALDFEFGDDDDYEYYEEMRNRMLDRAQALLELNLRTNHAAGKTLEWGIQDNRPALRLLAQRIYADGDMPPRAEKLANIEWMLALNPHDNHGIRELAMEAYLRLQQFDKALELSERYPDDASVDMQFGTLLALLATGQHETAAVKLAEANKFLPKVVPMLLAANPAKPKSDAPGGFIAHGSDYQAWAYRMDCLSIWQRQPHALEWLKAQIG